MRITYLGTGAAEGVPAEFCNCETCKEVRRRGGKDIHSRTQIVIDDTFGIDFPPDAYYHSIKFGVDLSAIENLIITHSHMDHFYAHDFILRGYKYAWDMSAKKLNIYGNKVIGKIFSECTRREIKKSVKKNISFTKLKLYKSKEIGDFIVTPLKAQHTRKEVSFVYLIEKEGKAYLHLTDTCRLYPEVYEFLKERGVKINLVTFDCTFLYFTKGEVGRHMGIEDNMAVKAKLEEYGLVDENTRYAITHYSHNNNPLHETLEKIEKEYGVTALYDGMTIEI